MITRREILQVGVATAAAVGGSMLGPLPRALAQQRLTQDELLKFDALGNVTLLHVADIHGQLVPVYFREPSINIGVGAVAGLPPHITGTEFLKAHSIKPGSREAYALTSVDFAALAKVYGRMGGLDRIATIVKHVRAERGANTLLLDGGDTWQGSYTANTTKGADMVEVMDALKPDAMTGHWEFTYGTERVREIIKGLPFPFLAGNIYDAEWDEPSADFKPYAMYERGGVKIGVVGQAFPYTPIANPRWMIPNWSFGIREEVMARNVQALRAQGAQLVVLLSHNGFDIDRKLASRVQGIDVILTSHTHDALPEPVKVGKTLLVTTGSAGKFVSRLDLDVSSGEVKGFRYRLIPVFSDVISPDKEMAALIDKLRAPYEKELGRVLGRTESLLYRRGNFNGTLDDLFCQALMSELDTEIALSPGFRWGNSLIPGQAITVEDLHSGCAMTYPAAYRNTMSGQMLKDVFEDVADNVFNPDPYYQQGGDMVRVGGMGYRIDPHAKMGSRISDMTLLRTGMPIEASREYTVAGWASVNEGTQGPPVWQVVEAHLAKNPVVNLPEGQAVKIAG